MTKLGTLPPPRKAVLRSILHPFSKEVLDRGLVLWFPQPHSFTGEDSVELHVHGGTAVVAAVMAALNTLSHFRQAHPGEFTRRAFSHGKLDLTGVEGLADLINAETEQQRTQALRQSSGALGELYEGWRRQLLEARARVEAYLDFGEEGNEIPEMSGELTTRVSAMCGAMERHLADNRRGEILRSGVKLAILGRPNVGKSSCLNSLLQRPAAIVSDVPGTTRDVVTGTVDIGGFPVTVMDTAGLRATEDDVERQGVNRALGSAREADAAVIVLDARDVLNDIRATEQCVHCCSVRSNNAQALDSYKISQIVTTNTFSNETIELSLDNRITTTTPQFDFQQYLLNHFRNCTPSVKLYDMGWFKEANYVVLLNKIDLLSAGDVPLLPSDACAVSLTRGDGLDSALSALRVVCVQLCSSVQHELPQLTAARHRLHVSAAMGALYCVTGDPLTNTESLLMHEATLASAAHHLHVASRHLGHVTGHVTTEQLLDQIFKDFCIGK